jgi:hypothetical protein
MTGVVGHADHGVGVSAASSSDGSVEGGCGGDVDEMGYDEDDDHCAGVWDRR